MPLGDLDAVRAAVRPNSTSTTPSPRPTTVAEIEQGVVGKERTDRQRGKVLRRWFENQVLPTFADRVLPFDLAAARIVADYRVPEHAPFDDALLAAIAQSAGMTVATRNTKHFEPPGVPCLNPWHPNPAVR